jgi:hypothetical protein
MRASKTKTHGFSGCRRSVDYPNWLGFQPHCMTGMKIGDSRLESGFVFCRWQSSLRPGPLVLGWAGGPARGWPSLTAAPALSLRPKIPIPHPPRFKFKFKLTPAALPLSAHKRHGASGPARRRQEAGAAESNGPYSRSITFT